MTKTYFAERLRELRDRHKMTQLELAEAIGVSPSWVSAFFSGRRNANDVPLSQATCERLRI